MIDITIIGNITDATITSITEKYHELRVAINTVFSVKHRFVDYKRVWSEIQAIVSSAYKAQKIVLTFDKEIKDLKSKDLREAGIDNKCIKLVKAMEKLEIIMGRFEQVEEEIKETLLYLNDLKSDVSRVQSGIMLALDTGEIHREYWRKEQ